MMLGPTASAHQAVSAYSFSPLSSSDLKGYHHLTAPSHPIPTSTAFGTTPWDVPHYGTNEPHQLPLSDPVHNDNATFLFKHPHPNSVIVVVSQVHSKNKQVPIPPSKEGRKLDTLGWCLYSTTSLAFRVANYQGAMGVYECVLLNKLQPLPDTTKSEASAIYEEAMAVAAQQMCLAKHIIDCTARSIGTAVTLRRHSWCRSTGLADDIRSQIEFQPFECEGLFHMKTDEIMDGLQKKQTAAKRLGIFAQCQQRPFRQPWERSFPSTFFRFSGSRDCSTQSAPSSIKTLYNALPKPKAVREVGKNQHRITYRCAYRTAFNVKHYFRKKKHELARDQVKFTRFT
ncbi:hypothetical protein JRQ81_017522 [Phrynocephalus forsythii]|uniref:Uncharacterized protein n=1 Tax=Phrynocephalus forsythii TaxID=171643 RepID=A0A9Q0XSG8_9SAUR|nr:hypothetical protein JRQ81_017522 [Phrynocephalus forsythii]